MIYWKQNVLEEGGGKYRSIYWIDAFLSINIDVSLDWIHLHYFRCTVVVSCIIRCITYYIRTLHLDLQGHDLQIAYQRQRLVFVLNKPILSFYLMWKLLKLGCHLDMLKGQPRISCQNYIFISKQEIIRIRQHIDYDFFDL